MSRFPPSDESGNVSLSRRRALLSTVAFGGLIAASAGAKAQLSRTPLAITGPYYPVLKPLDRDADLTHVRGRPGVAQGQVFELLGTVRNSYGEPVPGARIEWWQANTFGRYDHPSDPNIDAPLDPNFQGYAVQRTDAWGRYRFRSIVPGAYPATPEWLRSPHIHLDVTGNVDRMVTQLYFAGQPLNDTDRLFQALSPQGQASVLIELEPAADSFFQAGQLDIVLNQG
jgi:protocatechuate 3,4-dioxygenase beta subunit